MSDIYPIIKKPKTPVIEKAYKNIVLFFIAITAIIFIGFYNTYIVFFPNFEKFEMLHHIHGFVMMLWLVMLIVQPILIKKRKYKWHRAIGKFSYVLIPIIIISMLLVYKKAFLTSVAENGVADSQSLILLFLPMTDVLPFSAFYMLAIINRKKTANHLRYMISTAVVIVSAGLVRIFIIWLGMGFIGAIYATAGVIVLVFASLILYDYSNKRLRTNKSFQTALVIFLIPNLLLFVVPYTSWWQTIAEVLMK